MPAMKTYREAIFSGWFGPMGVGAVFLSEIAKEQMENIYEGQEEPVSIRLISPVVLFVVLSSTLVHGTTIPLFKIGKRIRTRTLSITSTGSGTQVLRLPKIQFGQQLSLKRNEDDSNSKKKHDEKSSEPMSQLERNTLMNTIQHDRLDQKDTVPSYTVDMEAPPPVDDEDMAEEDFLPDDPEEAVVKENSHAVPGYESQSIRFLEPVNPRSSASQQNKNGSNEEPRHLFRKGHFPFPHHHKDKNNDHPEAAEIVPDGLNPDIEIWEEPHHVSVENKNDPESQVMVDKSDPDWKNKLKNKIDEFQKKASSE